LLGRLHKITNETAYSVRDKKLLKKILLRQLRERKIDRDSIIYQFPGKTIESIKQQSLAMFTDAKSMQLMKIFKFIQR
jgi:hypothetical protein